MSDLSRRVKRLKDEVTIAEVVEHLGGVISSGGYSTEWRKVKCPFHGDRNASAAVGRVGFLCHGCGAPERPDGRAGDIFDVAKYHLQTTDLREAVEWIERTF